ncbi:MAG: flagellar basal body rod protein FlgC [Desulfobacterales bacterium]|nr:flagellar basal body rod protein FlgC [Desulfobacterales bacterium]
MDLMMALRISGTGLAAHRTKMNVIAMNLANAETTKTLDGGPYKRQMVVFEENAMDDFKSTLDREQEETLIDPPQKKTFTGVNVSKIVESQEDFRLVYNPSHPHADPITGYVAMPNVDHVTEMADMIVAQRAYEASAQAISNTKSMIVKALEIGR